MLNFYITTIVIIFTNHQRCDASLQRTLHFELSMSARVKSFVEQFATTFRKVERDVRQVVSSKWSPLEREDYVSTPLTAMALVRRLVQDWPALVTAAGSGSALRQLQLEIVRWPTVKDKDQAAKAVMRSQITYKLNNALLARGVQNEMFLTNVTVADYFEIARQYFFKELFSEANEWLQLALTRVCDTDVTPSRETLLFFKAVTLCFTGDPLNSKRVLQSILKVSPESKFPRELTQYYHIMSMRGCLKLDAEMYRHFDQLYRLSQINFNSLYYFRDNDLVEEHSKLCRSEVKVNSRLGCRYVHYQQPHLRFQPFKLEELQLDPPVVRFYDIITDKESDTIMNEAKDEMRPAKTYKDGKALTADDRTSYVSWLNQTHPRWAGLSRKVAEATRLDTNYAEGHQVSRYCLSGEFLPHTDYFDIEDWNYDRIATLMIYLTEVKQGGHTVFTDWKLSVPPVKNSAILWFNLKRNGQPDNTSVHSGCPVLRGTKWVLNEWFGNGAQHVNFPCTHENKESFKGFYML